MAQVYGAGGKTLPKRGRLGTGSYWPSGTPLAVRPGNAFGVLDGQANQYSQLTFGERSRAGIATDAQNRVQSQSLHPNKATYNLSTQPQMEAMVQSSIIDNNNLGPIPQIRAKLVMPHERNTNSAQVTHKKPLTYRTVFGASSSMAVDTAFDRDPEAQYKRQARTKPKPATDGVFNNVAVRTFARQVKPIPVAGGLDKSANPRTPPPSFFSHGQQWYDPHNSFIKGATTASAGHGTGRWNIVKKGVV